MKLFKYEGYQLSIEPEVLLLKPFKKIWTRDKTRGKNKALMELGFIYFFCDSRSDYQFIIDEDERMHQIKQGEGLPEDWKPDKAVEEAMEFYNSFKTTSSLLLDDLREIIANLRKTLKEIDLSKTDDNGKPVHNISQVVGAIEKIPSLILNVNKVEKEIASEVLEQNRMRGQGEKTIFEDDLSM